jgi:hypothetical protein
VSSLTRRCAVLKGSPDFSPISVRLSDGPAGFAAAAGHRDLLVAGLRPGPAGRRPQLRPKSSLVRTIQEPDTGVPAAAKAPRMTAVETRRCPRSVAALALDGYLRPLCPPTRRGPRSHLKAVPVKTFLPLAATLAGVAIAASACSSPTPGPGTAAPTTGTAATPASSSAAALVTGWELEPKGSPGRIKASGLDVLSAEGAAEHFHAHLDIFVDGKPVAVPADIGFSFAPDGKPAGISALHTHDESGIIHIEARSLARPNGWASC